MNHLRLILLLITILGVEAKADVIAVIGTGNVGQALGQAFAKQGHTVIYGSRTPLAERVLNIVAKTGSKASAALPCLAADVANTVVLAVPGSRAPEIAANLGDLSGKIVIDPTNAISGDWSTSVTLGVDTSNAQLIQAAIPNAHVVKAFNTVSWRQMKEPNGNLSIPLAGDSLAAKQQIAELVIGMGLKPIDVGGVENAHWVEGMTILWMNNRISNRPDFEFYLRDVSGESDFESHLKSANEQQSTH